MFSEGSSEGLGDEEDDDEEEFDWQVEQEVYKETSEEELSAMQMYGFGNKRSGVFARLQVRLRRPLPLFLCLSSRRTVAELSGLSQQEELSDVIDVKNPEQTTAAERRKARLEAEASAFSADHYL